MDREKFRLCIRLGDKMSEKFHRFSKITKLPGKPVKILVVDDDESIRSMLIELFQNLNCVVHSAKNGEEAFQIYRNQSDGFDLVILDFQMPVMGGKAAFAKIRSIEPTQKILMISGALKDSDLQKIISKKHVAFLSKPFHIDDIVEELNKLRDKQPSCTDKSGRILD